MSEKPSRVDQQKIVVGETLPFSVYGSEGQLLLAEGSVVETDHTRRMLILKGAFHDSAGDDPDGAEADRAPAESRPQSPLAALRRHYGATSVGRRFAVTVSAGDRDEIYNTWVIGVHEKSMILTTPRRTNGSLVSVKVGQAWICRALQMTSAFRFRTTVTRVAFEPFPHVHIEAPQHVERRTVRSRPRAAVFVEVSVNGPQRVPGVMVDLSVSGGRLAAEDGARLERGHSLGLGMTLDLIDSRFDLSLQAKVVREFGVRDGRHPRIRFYGINFDGAGERERLILHGYVSGQLAMELNSLWQLLSSATPTGIDPAAGPI